MASGRSFKIGCRLRRPEVSNDLGEEGGDASGIAIADDGLISSLLLSNRSGFISVKKLNSSTSESIGSRSD
jgi:hypothetical protein